MEKDALVNSLKSYALTQETVQDVFRKRLETVSQAKAPLTKRGHKEL